MTEFFRPLHLACADDDLRPNMSLIEIKNNTAIATNGSILVKLDLFKTSSLEKEKIEVLNGKYIHKEVWKEISKCEHLELDDERIVCHKNGIKKSFEYAEPNGTFFDISKVLIDVINHGTGKHDFVGMNSKYINILTKIFNNESLTYSFSKGENQGIIVYPYIGSGMFAVLMPCMLDGPVRYYFS